MTAPNDPATASPTGLETPPARLPPLPAGRENVPPRSAAEQLAAAVARLDRLLVAGVLLLAFFVASFRATNSDLWMHLAAGRLIAQGQFPFGADPFASTTAGMRWVNNAWLADLAAYGL